MCVTLPRTLISVVGVEKILPSWRDLEVFLALLPRSSTAERMNPYTSTWTGITPGDGPENFHLVLLDNGRTSALADPTGRQALRCIRCSACLNVCPVYERTGGHAYGSPYPGPIGAIISPLLRGVTDPVDASLPFASTLCGACYEVCPVAINIPEALVHLRAKVVDAKRDKNISAERVAFILSGRVLRSPRLLAAAQRAASASRKVVARKGRIRRLPPPLGGWTETRDAPAPPPSRSAPGGPGRGDRGHERPKGRAGPDAWRGSAPNEEGEPRRRRRAGRHGHERGARSPGRPAARPGNGQPVRRISTRRTRRWTVTTCAPTTTPPTSPGCSPSVPPTTAPSWSASPESGLADAVARVLAARAAAVPGPFVIPDGLPAGWLAELPGGITLARDEPAAVRGRARPAERRRHRLRGRHRRDWHDHPGPRPRPGPPRAHPGTRLPPGRRPVRSGRGRPGRRVRPARSGPPAHPHLRPLGHQRHRAHPGRRRPRPAQPARPDRRGVKRRPGPAVADSTSRTLAYSRSSPVATQTARSGSRQAA